MKQLLTTGSKPLSSKPWSKLAQRQEDEAADLDDGVSTDLAIERRARDCIYYGKAKMHLQYLVNTEVEEASLASGCATCNF